MPEGLPRYSKNTRRALALGALAALAALVEPAFVGDADARTTAKTFTVSSTVMTGCTFAVNDMTFPNYTRGSAFVDGATSSFSVYCASATAGRPVPVTYTVSAAGGFKMASGTNRLNYQLCFDAACADVIPNGTGTGLLVDRQTYTAPYYGQIFANQSVAVGPYSQVVNVSISY